MSGNKLSLLVNFVGVDKMSGAIKNITALGRKGSSSLNALRGEGRKLESQLRDVRRELEGSSGNVSHLVNREKELAREVARVNGELQTQKARLGQIAKAREIQAFGSKMRGAGQTASLYISAPIMAAGYASEQAARTFNTSMANISTLVDTSTESIDAMGKQVLSLSRRVPVQLDELPPALYNIRSAGIDASRAMQVLEGSSKLAVAGLGTTSEAADISTSALNAFNLKGDQAAKLYDTIFKTVKHGKTNISQLAQGFGGVAGTIASAGIQFDEFQASVAAITTTGAPASQAYTQLRAIVSGLTRETTQSRKVFRAMGSKDLKDLIAKSGGLVPALERIKKQVRGNDAAMLQLIGSTEGLNAVISLTGNQSGAFKETLAAMRSGGSAIDTAFAKQSATDQAKHIKDMNAMQSAAISAGKAILPVMTNVFQVVGSLAGKFAELSPGTQKFIVGALAIGAAIGPLLIGVGALVGLFGSLATVAAALGISVGVAAGLFFAIPVALGVAAFLVYRYWDKIKSAFWSALPALGGPMGMIAKLVYDNWGRIKGAFVNGWQTVKGWFTTLPGQMTTLGKAMIVGLLTALNPVVLATRLVSIAKAGITAFKNYLGIKSPSRVFMALGQHTTEGLARGIDRGGRRPLAAMGRLATGVTAAGAMSLTPMAAGAAATGGRNAAPMATASSGNWTVHIHLNQKDGQSAKEMAREIKDELDRLARTEDRGNYEDDPS